VCNCVERGFVEVNRGRSCRHRPGAPHPLGGESGCRATRWEWTGCKGGACLSVWGGARCSVWGDGAGARGVMYGLGDSLDVVCCTVVFVFQFLGPKTGAPRRRCTTWLFKLSKLRWRQAFHMDCVVRCDIRTIRLVVCDVQERPLKNESRFCFKSRDEHCFTSQRKNNNSA